MYANPLLIVKGHKLYRVRTAYLFIIRRFWPNPWYINIRKQCKCPVQLTEHTGRELSSSLIYTRVVYLRHTRDLGDRFAFSSFLVWLIGTVSVISSDPP